MSKGQERRKTSHNGGFGVCKKGLTQKFATENGNKTDTNWLLEKKDRTEDKQHEIQDFVSAINETVLADSKDLENRD